MRLRAWPGAFIYTPTAGTVLTAGTQTLHVDFTPTDTTDYNATSMDVPLTVTKITPTISWATPADIVYGTALGSAQLNATASVAGTLVYTPAIGAVLNAGTQQTLHVDLTPSDGTNYNPASLDVQINVLKATPTITWVNPADVSYGTPLNGTQLNATANVAGSFVYTPPVGTVLEIGSHTLHVDFSPTDAVDYNSNSQNVPLNVQLILQSITVTPSQVDIALGGVQQFIATGVLPNGDTLDVSGLATWLSSDGTAAGINSTGLVTGLGASSSVTVTAAYGGVSGTATLTVGKPVILTPPANQIFSVGGTVIFSVAATGAGPLSYQWQVNGANVDGATSSTFSAQPNPSDDGSQVTVIVSNAVGSVTSSPAVLTLLVPTTIVTYPANQSVAVGTTVSFSVTAVSSYPLTYQWQRLGRGASVAQDISGATSPDYTTPPVTTADQGAQYSVRVQDTQGNICSSVRRCSPSRPLRRRSTT